jgi:hypothetical protein
MNYYFSVIRCKLKVSIKVVEVIELQSAQCNLSSHQRTEIILLIEY